MSFLINFLQPLFSFYFGAGLEPAVFAALVPNAANKPVEELIEEIMGDHEAMVRKNSLFRSSE